MAQAKLSDSGDLEIRFQDYNEDDNIVVYKLTNDSELEFVNDECVAVVLPSFEQKFNRGPLDQAAIRIQDYWIEDDTAFFNIEIGMQTVNIKISLSSLKDKV